MITSHSIDISKTIRLIYTITTCLSWAHRGLSPLAPDKLCPCPLQKFGFNKHVAAALLADHVAPSIGL